LIRTSTETVPDALVVACTVQGSSRFGDPKTASVTVEGSGDGGGGDGCGGGGGGDGGVGGGVAVGVKVATPLSLDSLFAKSYAVIT
jgi:hypothetical protein